MARPFLRVLQVSGGKQVEGEQKKQRQHQIPQFTCGWIRQYRSGPQIIEGCSYTHRTASMRTVNGVRDKDGGEGVLTLGADNHHFDGKAVIYPLHFF